MRVVWLLGGTEPARQQIERALLRKAGVKYVVRRAENIDDIPEDHYGHMGVAALVDAFHPDFQGFEGAKALRARGFFGALFLCGEPAPEVAATMLPQLDLAGFFPPFDRLDAGLVSGVLHTKFFFEGQVDLEWFLNPGGRSSIETIRTLKDFHAFCTKLATFVSRFGVDVQQLKKVLMGLTLPHVKTASGTLAVEQPFTIQYGMDPSKVLLGISSFSRGSSWAVMRGEMSSALSQLKNPQAPISSMLPEIHHVVRATENILLFSGSARATKEEADPVFLLTSLLFPSAVGAAGKGAAPSSYMCVTGFVQSTPDMSEDEANARPEGQTTASSPPPADEVQEMPADPLDSVSGEPAQDNAPSGTIENDDLDRILSEPQVIGDTPKAGPPPSTAPRGRAPAEPESKLRLVPDASDGGGEEEMVAKGEVDRLKDICTAMGNDIRRLMRERREPTTNPELREAKTDLEEKVRKLLEERTALSEQIAERERQIEVLKAQVESLRRAA